MWDPIYSAVKNRKVTLFVVFLAIVFGAYSYYITPKQESPDVNVTVALISAIYPGASPEDVERLVTRKIEEKCAEVSGYDYSSSHSNSGIAIVVMRLEQDAGVDEAWSQLRQKMEDLQGELPKECEKIEINTDLMETSGIIISISGDNYTYEELASFAGDFKEELSRIEGMSRFDVTGEQEFEVVAEVDAAKLNYYIFSLGDISNIIASQNIEIPSGTIDDGESKISVKINGGYDSLEEIGSTVLDVSRENGSLVRLRDTADISMKLQESNYRIKQNGRNAVLLAGYFKENRNILIIGREVERKLAELKKSLPADIIIDKVLYQPGDVGKSAGGFAVNLLEGVLFVIAVVFIGMGFRNALIVSTAIPLSIFLTFGAMNVLGVKIHSVSIAALIVALGMLVDNAIVISDATQVRIDRGQERMGACIEGVKEVAIPVLTSTLTTVAAFLPLLLLPSMAGEYVSSLPVIVMISLSASYLTALFVTPTMAYIFFRQGKKTGNGSAVRKLFGTMLASGMKRRTAIILVTITVVAAAAFTATRLGLQFFPRAETDMIYIDVKAEQNQDISKTEELVEKISGVLSSQKEIVSYTAAIGSGLPKFFSTLPLYTNSQDNAQIMMRVDLGREKRFVNNGEMVDFLQNELDSTITGGTATVKQLEIGEPIGSPIIVRITGNDMEILEELAREVRSELKNIEGTVNVDDDIADRVYELCVDVDTDRASYCGISKYDVQREVSTALYGRTASVFRVNGREYDIKVKSGISTKEELENLAVKSSYTGKKILLKEIANVALSPRVPTIRKYDRELAVTVSSDVRPGYSSAKILGELNNRMGNMNTAGARVVLDGEKAKIDEHFGNIGDSAIFAVLLIYGILLLQFGSFVQPLIILITIPLSAIGSVFGLYITGQPLSFMGLLGIVSLMGVVVNNAIILIDYINARRSEGMGIDEACMQASDKRLRPIILTTVTTVVGLVPLVFSQGSLFKPMAVSLMSGLSVSTLLTLVVIPVVYSMVESGYKHVHAKIRKVDRSRDL